MMSALFTIELYPEDGSSPIQMGRDEHDTLVLMQDDDLVRIPGELVPALIEAMAVVGALPRICPNPPCADLRRSLAKLAAATL